MEKKKRETIMIDLYTMDGLDPDIHGFISPHTNGKEGSYARYEIFLNGNADDRRRLATFLHEMCHIFNHDFARRGESADQIEARTHRQLIEALELLKEES